MSWKSSTHSSQLSPAGSCRPAVSRSSGWLLLTDNGMQAPKQLVCAVVARKVIHDINCVLVCADKMNLTFAESQAYLSFESAWLTTLIRRCDTHTPRESPRAPISCSALLFDTLRLLFMPGEWSSEEFPSLLITRRWGGTASAAFTHCKHTTIQQQFYR